MISKQEKIKYLKSVIAILAKEKIWYSLDGETMRGAFQFGGLIPNEHKLSLMITPEGYQTLMRKYPKRMLDSSVVREYKSLHPAFVRDISGWKEEQPFVEFRIIIKTTSEKVDNFESTLSRLKNKVKSRPLDTKNAINDLKTTKYEGFYLISDSYININRRWIQVISNDTKEITLNNSKPQVIKEIDVVINEWWPKINMASNPGIREGYFEYPSPGVRKKVKL